MRVTRVVNLLKESLDRFEFVSRPDHPYLIRGPDVIVLVKSALVGVFIVKATERRAPDLLVERAALSRLAYPNGFFTVALIPKEYNQDPDIESRVGLHFDRVVFEGGQTALRKGIEATAKLDARFVDRDTREVAFEQATILFNQSIREFKRGIASRAQSNVRSLLSGRSTSSSGKYPLETTVNVLDHRPWSKYFLDPGEIRKDSSRAGIPVFKAGRFVVGVSDLRKNDRSEILSRFAFRVFASDYQLDNGLPYKSQMARNVLLSNQIPVNRFDPMKWVRGSAFAGFAILFPSQDLDKKLDRIERILNKVWRPK